MQWSVVPFQEEAGNQDRNVVNGEALRLLADQEIKLDVAKLIGWARAVAKGEARPTGEPFEHVDEYKLYYRCVGGAALIFALIPQKGKLVLLLFGRSGSSTPKHGDFGKAAERWKKWRARDGN
jgi:hypothetical protein